MTTLIQRLELHEMHVTVALRFHPAPVRPPRASLLAVASAADGTHGIGEGCPGAGADGESFQSARAFLQTHHAALTEQVHDLASLRAWVNAHAGAIARSPAAWCAIELALLDLLARAAHVSVEALLGLPRMNGTFYYTAVAEELGNISLRALIKRYRDLGMHDFKITLSGERARDQAVLDSFRMTTTPRLRVRASLVHPWLELGKAIAYVQALDYPLFALEDPLADTDPRALVALAASLDTRIVLNDSLTSLAQLEAFADQAERFIVYVNLSKWGGLLRALELIERCRALGIPVIVGAQVGETSLLTRAALTLANAARDLLVAQEGAFGTLVHDQDPCQPQLMFGIGGALRLQDTALAARPGFGIQVAAPAIRP
jgi:L-alanine-DL-glutamate epimerase-like enolase superfamily enzyme